jgi:hypothetical protein
MVLVISVYFAYTHVTFRAGDRWCLFLRAFEVRPDAVQLLASRAEETLGVLRRTCEVAVGVEGWGMTMQFRSKRCTDA